MLAFKVVEDRSGNRSLYVFSAEGCIFAKRDLSNDWLCTSVEQLRQGRHPIHDNWETGERDPARYCEDVEVQVAGNPTELKVVADNFGLYLSRMSLTAFDELKNLGPRDVITQ